MFKYQIWIFLNNNIIKLEIKKLIIFIIKSFNIIKKGYKNIF